MPILVKTVPKLHSLDRSDLTSNFMLYGEIYAHFREDYSGTM